MSVYEIRQEGDREPWASFSYAGEHPADRNAARADALGRALEGAQAQSRQRGRAWVVEHVDGAERVPLARYPGSPARAEAERPEDENRWIQARKVRPGVIAWNPYGGRSGRLEVASEPRERPDGTVEFDVADGRTGQFRPGFLLRLDRAAMERAEAERATAEREAGS